MKLGKSKYFKIRYDLDGEYRTDDIYKLLINNNESGVELNFQSKDFYAIACDDFNSNKIEKLDLLEYCNNKLTAKYEFVLYAILIDGANIKIKGKMISHENYVIRKSIVEMKVPKINDFIGKL